MNKSRFSIDRDAVGAARDYLARELSGKTTRGKPRGTPRHRRPKLNGTPVADAVREGRR